MTPCPHLLSRIMAVMDCAFDPEFGEAWNVRQVSDALALPNTHGLVVDANCHLLEGATQDGDGAAPAGFTLSRQAADEEELLLIGVAPQFRRRGLGTGLLGQMFDAARARGVTRVFLEMREGNPAIHLYERAGFAPIGRRPQYYRLVSGDRLDAITFSCAL